MQTLVAALDRFLEAAAVADVIARRLAPIERRLEAAMIRAFRLQEREFLRRFERLRTLFAEALTEGDWQPAFQQATAATSADFVAPIGEAVEAALLAGGEAAAIELAIEGSFNLANPRAVAYLRDYGALRVAGINETTRGYLRTIITDGVEQGWSYNRMAKAISDRYGEFRVGQPQKHIASRAHMIAVTEAGDAYSQGTMGVAQDLAVAGIPMEKHWLVTGGEICPLCLSNGGQGWIPLDDDFSSGHSRPLGHPGCRCALQTRRRRGAHDVV